MSNMRIGGLASGMDIDGIVEKLMQAEKAPLNKLQQQQQKYEWERDAYREINTALSTFSDFLFDGYRLMSNFNKKTVSSTNDSLVSATATAAATGSLSIEGVSQLATSWQGVGKKIEANLDTKMSDIPDTNFTGSTLSIKAIQDDGKIAEKETSIEIKSTDTIGDVIKKINSSNAGVTAIFENGSLSVTANNTGSSEGKSVEIGDSGNALGSLGFNINTDNTDGSKVTEAKNADFQVNGIATERSSNTFSLNGYSVTLKSTFDETVSPVTLTSSTNTDEMVDKIKKFVETYNGLVTTLNDKLKETKYRDYQPLSDDQREDMEDDEIKKWEEKAKSGLLRGDSILSSGLYSLRRTFSESIKGLSDSSMDSLSEIGITTTSSYSDGGKLQIDEDKLRDAIAKNPDQVAQIFTKTGEKNDSINGVSQDTRGLAQKLRDELDNFTKNIEKKAGKTTSTNHNFTIGKRLLDIEDRVDTWKSKLQLIEERYWKQFTRMEQAINKANQQSSMFMPQM